MSFQLRPYRLIDLFAGAGGFTLGFTQCRVKGRQVFEPVWANDFNKYAVETYNINFGGHCLPGDIVSLLENDVVRVPEADIVIGGPPCQGFSLLNKNREGDPRKQLWRPFMEVVQRSGASAFVIENVPELLNSLEHAEIVDAAGELGFRVSSAKLCAADYGAPQVRYRAFIVGSRSQDPAEHFPPRRTHYNPKTGASNGAYAADPRPWRTVREAIADLEPPVGTEIRNEPPPYDLHFGRSPTALSLERYRAVPGEGMNRFDLQERRPDLTPGCWIRKTKGGTDLFGRLWWDRPAFTVRTEFFKPEKGRHLHPEQHRPITHREAARFQSFPDEFLFTGSKIEIAKQIGNAVPPVLAKHVAESVLAMMEKSSRPKPEFAFG